MKKLFLFLLILPALFNLNAKSRIVNGTETGYKDHQGAVGLIMSSPSQISHCTGTLIHPRVVLTAGHCTTDRYGMKFNEIEVYGGSNIYHHKFTSSEKIYHHERWYGKNYEGSVDIALIYLKDPITGVNFYGLPKEDATIGNTGTIVGYGDTKYNDGKSGIHRKGSAKVISIPKKCIINIGGTVEKGFSGLCSGDSGGPFFVKEYDREVVMGVSSYVTRYCDGTDGHDLYVPCYKDWIMKTAQNQFGVTITDPEGEVEPECRTQGDCKEDFACYGGICMEQLKENPCSKIYRCLENCELSDYICNQKCRLHGTAEGKEYLSKIEDCSENNCKHLYFEELDECRKTNCSKELEECMNQEENDTDSTDTDNDSLHLQSDSDSTDSTDTDNDVHQVHLDSDSTESTDTDFLPDSDSTDSSDNGVQKVHPDSDSTAEDTDSDVHNVHPVHHNPRKSTGGCAIIIF